VAVKVNRALVLTTIWAEGEASAAPFVDHVGLGPEVAVVPNEQLEVAQVWVALLDARAKDLLVGLDVIILLGLANIVLEKLLEFWIKL